MIFIPCSINGQVHSGIPCMSKLLYSFCSDGEINMVMEYMDGGSLDLVMKKRGKIEEQYSRKITYAVSTFILYVHDWLKPLMHFLIVKLV